MKNFGYLILLILISASSVSAQQRFVAYLSGLQEVPSNTIGGRGTCTIVLNAAQDQITVNCTFSGLGSNANAGHIHGNGAVGVNAPVLFPFTGVPANTGGTFGPLTFAVTPAQVANMRAHLYYVNIHSVNLPGGEIRGQIKQAFTVIDHDGDGRTDLTVFRQSTNDFWIQNSLNNSASIYNIGTGSGDIWLNNTADFDGDGRGDPMLLKLDASANASWRIYQTSTNTIRTVLLGIFTAAMGDTLAISDYDGDGIQDPAIFRRSTGDWWSIRSTNAGVMTVLHWGTLNDFPSIGDYDGDGKADLTVVRVEGGQRVWYILNSSNGSTRREVFGASATDGVFFFAPFDMDGDGRQDIAVNRIVGGQRQFHFLRSSDNQYNVVQWGLNTDTALFGDYDGDGKTDLVARRNNGANFVWYIRRSSDLALEVRGWGLPTDQLVNEDEIYNAFVQGR